MRHEILYPGPFATLKVDLDKGEAIKAEAGAMMAMSDTINIEGKMDGGFFKGLGRMLAGESFFFQTLVAERGPGEALLAHEIPGEIQAVPMDGNTNYILQKNGFFAATSGVEISNKTQNLIKGLFSGEGFFVIHASGTGMLFISSYGAIHPLDLSDGQEYIIDNAHLVAWPEQLDYKIEKASSGWISSATSGEGLVCRFRGPGRVYIQTRNPPAFGSWVRQFIPSKK